MVVATEQTHHKGLKWIELMRYAMRTGHNGVVAYNIL